MYGHVGRNCPAKPITLMVSSTSSTAAPTDSREVGEKMVQNGVNGAIISESTFNSVPINWGQFHHHSLAVEKVRKKAR